MDRRLDGSKNGQTMEQTDRKRQIKLMNDGRKDSRIDRQKKHRESDGWKDKWNNE